MSARVERFVLMIDIVAMHHSTTAEVAGGRVVESYYEYDGERVTLPAICAMPMAAFADKPPRP